ncbi:MAG: hypothetical protein MJZ88_02560 [Paludibacteraceae bacterium]|nr:hypothetical protein [Paludibacteraceae bacterium]
MKNNILKICLILCTVLGTVKVMAERPIWVVGHACNSQRCLIKVLDEGGCGVEIDVFSDAANKDKAWSVNHGGGFRDSVYNAKVNRGRDWLDRYVYLEEYLNLQETSRLSILWLDVKSPEYLINLVQHVHKVLDKVYDGKQPPYSIIYGVYKIDQLSAPIPDGSNDLVIDWLRDNLRSNEGINLAWEGKDKNQINGMGSGFIWEIEKLMNDHSFPTYKHFMTCGYFNSKRVHSNSVEPACILEAKKLRNEGKYCSRIGYWTCRTYKDAIWFIEPKWAGIQTECDLVLVECHNEFILGDHDALEYFVKYYFREDGCYYKKYNAHNTRIANQDDVFFR